LKKEPLKRYAKENGGSLPIIGVRAEESKGREEAWLSSGCNALTNKTPACYPLMVWTGQRVLEYLKRYDVEYCREIYGEIVEVGGKLKTTGESSTGCVVCLVGCQFDPMRYVRLYHLDQKKHEYCMDAGAREVLEYLGLPAYPGQHETAQLFADAP
jgi:hypothetical protein